MDIIFDIGNVICTWNPQKLASDLFSDPAEQARALAAVFQHEDWLAMDKGLMPLDKAIKNAQERSNLDPEKIKSLYRNTPPSLLPLPETVRAIKELSSNSHRLFVLSNMQQHAWQYLENHYDFWSLFDGIVVSFKINLIKPDPQIFDHILQKYGITASSAIFLDDLADNILAARSFGLHTIHVTDINDSINRLYEILGNVH